MKVGDTWPPLKGQANDPSGDPVDLSTAASMEAIVESATHTIVFGDPPSAISEDDPDHVHHWNWQQTLRVGDTDIAGTYKVLLRVTWADGEIETYPSSGSETLVIEAD